MRAFIFLSPPNENGARGPSRSREQWKNLPEVVGTCNHSVGKGGGEAETGVGPLPQTELAMNRSGGQRIEAVQEVLPDDLDQSPTFDPADPDPVPEDDFNQSWDA